jgi:hypothetical protein
VPQRPVLSSVQMVRSAEGLSFPCASPRGNNMLQVTEWTEPKLQFVTCSQRLKRALRRWLLSDRGMLPGLDSIPEEAVPPSYNRNEKRGGKRNYLVQKAPWGVSS